VPAGREEREPFCPAPTGSRTVGSVRRVVSISSPRSPVSDAIQTERRVWLAETGGRLAGTWELVGARGRLGTHPPVAGYVHRLMMNRAGARPGTGRTPLRAAERRGGANVRLPGPPGRQRAPARLLPGRGLPDRRPQAAKPQPGGMPKSFTLLRRTCALTTTERDVGLETRDAERPGADGCGADTPEQCVSDQADAGSRSRSSSSPESSARSRAWARPSCSLLLLIAAPDPRAELHTYDMKGTGDLDPVGEAVSHRHGVGQEDETIRYALGDFRALREELRRRTKVIRSLPRDICPEPVLTLALRLRVRCRPHHPRGRAGRRHGWPRG
jgi:hypothetical protein